MSSSFWRAWLANVDVYVPCIRRGLIDAKGSKVSSTFEFETLDNSVVFPISRSSAGRCVARKQLCYLMSTITTRLVSLALRIFDATMLVVWLYRLAPIAGHLRALELVGTIARTISFAERADRQRICPRPYFWVIRLRRRADIVCTPDARDRERVCDCFATVELVNDLRRRPLGTFPPQRSRIPTSSTAFESARASKSCLRCFCSASSAKICPVHVAKCPFLDQTTPSVRSSRRATTNSDTTSHIIGLDLSSCCNVISDRHRLVAPACSTLRGRHLWQGDSPSGEGHRLTLPSHV